MSTAKPVKPKPIEDDENARSQRELVVFLEQMDGFELGLASYDVPQTREAVLVQLAEKLVARPVFLSRLDLSKTPDEKQLLQRLRQHIEEIKPAVPAGKHPAVMVTGLEATLDYRKLGPDAAERMAILHNANFQRDAFVKLCPVAVVFWLNPTATTSFAQQAPDLWHWRTGTFEFTGPPQGRAVLERDQLDMPGITVDNLSRAEKVERIATLRDLLVELENAGDCTSPAAKARRANLLEELGSSYDSLGDTLKSIGFFEEALGIFREIGDRHHEAEVLEQLGSAFNKQGMADRAIEYLKQALQLSREINDKRGVAGALGNLGWTHVNNGQKLTAMEYFPQALQGFREVSDRRNEGYVLLGMGKCSNQGEMKIDYILQALQVFREIGDLKGQAGCLHSLGLSYHDLNQWEKAVENYEQALTIFQNLGDRDGEAAALSNLGHMCLHLEQGQRGIKLLQKALRLSQELHNPGLTHWVSQHLQKVNEKGLEWVMQNLHRL